jgi:hypothetical protein
MAQSREKLGIVDKNFLGQVGQPPAPRTSKPVDQNWAAIRLIAQGNAVALTLVYRES